MQTPADDGWTVYSGRILQIAPLPGWTADKVGNVRIGMALCELEVEFATTQGVFELVRRIFPVREDYTVDAPGDLFYVLNGGGDLIETEAHEVPELAA
jgi:hypothetical protein